MKPANKSLPLPIVWILQFPVALLGSFIATLSMFLGTIPHMIFMYAILPMFDACITARFVLRGLNNYLALLAPFLMMPVGYLLIWGYMPNVGPVIVNMVISVFGAAYGEVRRTHSK